MTELGQMKPKRADGGDIDDHTLAVLFEMGKRGLDIVGITDDVCLEHMHPDIAGHILKLAEPKCCCVVNLDEAKIND